MITIILSKLALIITATINNFGNVGVTFLMALESCNIPIPSEVILPYAGFLASRGILNWHLAALAGGIGCLLGSMLSYWIGIKVGRPFLIKYGRWLLISEKDIFIADKFIVRYGDLTYFFSRLLPVVRTFISLIAGATKGNFKRFCFYTFIGSWLWSYILIYAGLKLGENWNKIGPLWDRFHETIIIIIIIGVGWHIYRTLRKPKSQIV